MSAGFDLPLHFPFQGENLLHTIYSASVKRLGTKLFVCLLYGLTLTRMQPFGIIIKAAIKGAAFVNAIDVRLLLIRFLPDDSHPVHQSKTSYVGKHLYCV